MTFSYVPSNNNKSIVMIRIVFRWMLDAMAFMNVEQKSTKIHVSSKDRPEKCFLIFQLS